MKPLGIVNNNPLNIRYSPMNNWKGQIGTYKGFCRFDTMEHGFRAALVLLHNYVKRGNDTIVSIIYRWAPATENDCEAYVDHVMCHFNGYDDPDYRNLLSTDRLPVDDPEKLFPFLFELAWIMSLVETGYLSKAKRNGSWPEEVENLYDSLSTAYSLYFHR